MNVQTKARPQTLRALPERLHHYAFIIKDQEASRHFFEDILGIPLVATWCERARNAVLGRELDYCHTFYGLSDGGALAFFQYADDDAYEQLKALRPAVGQHIALKVSKSTYDEIKRRLVQHDVAHRETDHGYCQSIYVMSPDQLRVEFTVDPPNVADIHALRRADCHAELARCLKGDHRINNTDRPHK